MQYSWSSLDSEKSFTFQKFMIWESNKVEFEIKLTEGIRTCNPIATPSARFGKIWNHLFHVTAKETILQCKHRLVTPTENEKPKPYHSGDSWSSANYPNCTSKWPVQCIKIGIVYAASHTINIHANCHQNTLKWYTVHSKKSWLLKSVRNSNFTLTWDHAWWSLLHCSLLHWK